MHGNGENVRTWCKSAGNRDSDDEAVGFGPHCLRGRKQVGVISLRHILPCNFFAVEIDDDAVVTLAAEFQAGELLLSCKGVAKIGGVAVLRDWRPPDVHACETRAVAEP